MRVFEDVVEHFREGWIAKSKGLEKQKAWKAKAV
jgi:hypothetical protein